MSAPIPQRVLDQAFNHIVELIAQDARMIGDHAMTDRFGYAGAAIMTNLIKQGEIKSEMYNRNWRVVTILKDKHAGKHTLRCPHPGKRRTLRIAEPVT